ncbi:MAG: repressor LexA [Candidatus Taylorbacteria bacterium RIFCSPHIGHO2_01_FULL_43_120]|nr:MAG: repressor LexA [Candidatus Taylorbacteria bacterium RIFCSPHIGHO2_01_FULL_43_120]OHA22997.1 MAG: repressor LexA [Candidatus Taylorbacteria bacterium RIFCSPHIGHO2_02_FULL_43_55]OHA30113.1 MAG: repressor LexA [Candidatus Taylorbacteria bacterium RIFCSPHIGHO2_12_FULL_42_34]OHA30711.1 MAG: repressor LexA [Candidatus Taylorbacteria bacterium RIFCSPLOWO2_01_FULL_43_83]
MSYENYKNKIANFYRNSKRMPSYSEIMKLIGFRSKNSVYKLVNRMTRDGSVSKDSSGRLIPLNIYGEIKMLGMVEAGFPSAAEEELQDTMSMDEYLIENKEATYMLKVKGDSMIDAGIQEGDMVIVEKARPPREGDIVIAEVDGGWTMKYFRKKGGLVWLEPANKKYKPIFPGEEMRVAAVVRAVVRKY